MCVDISLLETPLALPPHKLAKAYHQQSELIEVTSLKLILTTKKSTHLGNSLNKEQLISL